MSTQHTPGPWRVGDAGATVFGPPNGNPSPETVANVRRKANARLIAAAPDLLAALRLGKCDAWVHNAAITDDIEALRRIALFHAEWWNKVAMPLIAKAEGREP